MSQNESFRVAGSPHVSQPCGFAALVSKWLMSMARQPTPSAATWLPKAGNFWVHKKELSACVSRYRTITKTTPQITTSQTAPFGQARNEAPRAPTASPNTHTPPILY